MVSEIAFEAPRNTQQAEGKGFSAPDWLNYFQKNKENRITLRCPEDLEMSVELRAPLLRSLQRFQIGETGEGNHLRKYARSMGDPVYEECIDLFIKEEQTHARMLAELIAGLDGTLLTWHWTDLAFIVLRRMLGLKTELFILLIAEIVGKCFYTTCARSVSNSIISDAFSVIAIDEIAHLQFHCQFLAAHMVRFSQPERRFVHFCWAALFYLACLVFILDHGKTLVALGTTPGKFFDECAKEFRRAASHSLVLKIGEVIESGKSDKDS